MSNCYGEIKDMSRPCPRCGGIMSLTPDVNSDCLIEQCREKKCTYTERYKNRRKSNLPFEVERRK